MATGTIVQSFPVSGSNTKGNYIKFPDGTLIQYGNVLDISFSSQDIKEGTADLPTSFYDTNYKVFGSCFTSSKNNLVLRVGLYPNTASNFSWSLATNTSTTVANRGFNWMAIGRWKA